MSQPGFPGTSYDRGISSFCPNHSMYTSERQRQHFTMELIEIMQVAMYKMFTIPWICSHVPDILSPDKCQRKCLDFDTQILPVHGYTGAPTLALGIEKPTKRIQFIRLYCLWKTEYRLFLVQKQYKIIYYKCTYNNILVWRNIKLLQPIILIDIFYLKK